METKGNVCLTSCEAACCKNMLFRDLTAQELRVLTPAGTKVKEELVPDHVYERHERRSYNNNGIYYTRLPNGRFVAAMVGPCANLGSDHSCRAYRDRPRECRDFPEKSSHCVKARKTDGIKNPQNFTPLSELKLNHQPAAFSLKRLLGTS